MILSATDLTVFANRFAGIAEEMGVALKRTAFSPNIKERRDYSCAVFDATCALIAQAAHIPVHLGSMGASTRAAVRALELGRGDVAILNDPYAGGTHLPDITVVTPVYLPGGDSPSFYVANRAHHADVGGATIGSMPLVQHIDDEGLRLAPQLLMRGDEPTETWAQILAAVQTPTEREGDLRAQVAANHVGAQRLAQWCAGSAVDVPGSCAQLLDYGERLARAALAHLPEGEAEFADVMESDGFDAHDVTIRARVSLRNERLSIDFAGTDPQVPGGINAVASITRSACEYVLRCLLGASVPANGGVSRLLDVHAPEGSLVAATPPAAVAAGNVETSQRIVDVVLGALAQWMEDRIPAASAGTMNNVTIGGVHPVTKTTFAYYETIAGGAGAGPQWHGAHGVQTHMTNTLNTPIESLEHDYPFRVHSYRLRSGSGGLGRFQGGEGVERCIEVLAPATVTLLTERRERGPWGLAGGEPGAVGENVIRRANGTQETLDSKVTIRLSEGDQLIVRTPGGGGFGERD